MAIVCLAIEQGTDSDSDFDACTSFATNALATELLAVARIGRLSHRLLSRHQFVCEADLSFQLLEVLLLVV